VLGALLATLPDLPVSWRVVRSVADAVRLELMKRTIRDVLGDPQSWPNYRNGAWGRPLLQGATIVSASEAEPDELRVAIEADGQMMHSTFVITDRDVRHRLLEILQPGILLDDSLNHLL
jgi:hypothetical protein